MAYTKTEWKARQGVNLNKFTKSQETAGSVILTNTPDAVTEPGTPFSTENLNKIEHGIEDAHIAIESFDQQILAEAEARAQGDNDIHEVIGHFRTEVDENKASKNHSHDDLIGRDEIGTANGVAGLDADGKVLQELLPEGIGGNTSSEIETHNLDNNAHADIRIILQEEFINVRQEIDLQEISHRNEMMHKLEEHTSDLDAHSYIHDLLSGKIGVANGVASLDAEGKVPLEQLPEMGGNRSYPVGAYYTQYPVTGQSTLEGMFPDDEAPAALFGGTWTERFCDDEVYFRTGGLGNRRGQTWANGTWGSGGTVGVEIDAIRNFPATGAGVYYNSPNGPFFGLPNTAVNLGSSGWYLYSQSFDPSRVVPTDTTNHPRNRLIKVWQKTA